MDDPASVCNRKVINDLKFCVLDDEDVNDDKLLL